LILYLKEGDLPIDNNHIGNGSTAESCSVRGWPDRKEIQNAFRLQALLCDLELLRFEHLVSARRNPTDVTYKPPASISEISKLIHQEWSHIAEMDQSERKHVYKDLMHAIDVCRSLTTPDALTGPFRDAQRDPEYFDARRMPQEALAECDRELGHP